LTGGNFSNDYQMHLQNKANLRNSTQDFMQRIFPVDRNSSSYRNAYNTTNSVIDGVLIGSSIGGLYKAGNVLASKTLDLCSKSSQLLKRFNSYPGVNSTTGLSLNNKAYSGLDLERIVKDVKQSITRNASGNLKSLKRIQVTKQIQNWLGKNYKTITNEANDKIFLSKDGLKKVRFDFNRTKPHENPHMHIEEYINGNWFSYGDQIYPKDVPKK
jgi:hypothetical protein